MAVGFGLFRIGSGGLWNGSAAQPPMHIVSSSAPSHRIFTPSSGRAIAPAKNRRRESVETLSNIRRLIPMSGLLQQDTKPDARRTKMQLWRVMWGAREG